MSTFIDCSDTLNCATLSGSNNVNVNFQAGVPNKIVVSLSQSVVGLSNLEVTGTIKSKAMQLSNSAGYSYLEIGAPIGAYIDLKNPESDDYDLRIISDSTPAGGGYLQAAGGAILSLSGNNVGIGTKAPSAQLDVAGAIRAGRNDTSTEGGEIQLARAFDNAAKWYIDTNGSNDNSNLRIFDNSSSVAFLIQSVSRNVGIGTSNPTSNLHISSTGSSAFLIEADTNNSNPPEANAKILMTQDAGRSTATFLMTSGSDDAVTTGNSLIIGVSSPTAPDMHFCLSSSTSEFLTSSVAAKMTITNAGNVGIGITNPAFKLDIAGSTGRYDNSLHINKTSFAGSTRAGITFDNNWTIGQSANGNATRDFFFYNGATAATALYISTTNNVGIGTSSPNAKLEVNGNIMASAGVPSDGTGFSFSDSSTTGMFSKPTNQINFYNNDTLNMTIKATGEVGIGTASPTTKLDINGTLRVRSLVAGTNTAPGRAATGEITALSSDKRLKKDISILSDSLSKVKNLRGVNFKWDKTNEPDFIIDESEKEKQQIGLIAQEVELIYPELVYLNGVKDYKGVRYPELTAVLIEAVKELSLQNDELKQKLDVVMARLSALENK